MRRVMGQRGLRQQGSVALLVALVLTVLIGFLALSLDIGNLYRIHAELQNAADSAALAGAGMLDGTEAGIDAARQEVQKYILEHRVSNREFALLDDDIEFGWWDTAAARLPADSRTQDPFENMGSNPDDPTKVNAVRVTTKRNEEVNGPVRNFFAGIIGQPETDVSADAIAVGGGPYNAECAFPLVVPDCVFENADPGGSCSYCMIFQNNNNDTAGWTSFNPHGVIQNQIPELIVDACYDSNGDVSVDPTSSECIPDACLDRKSDQEIQVANGNGMQSGNAQCDRGNWDQCNSACRIIQNILTRDGSLPKSGASSFVVKVPVLKSSPGTCDANQFSSTKPIGGFATLEIFAASCASSADLVTVASPPEQCAGLAPSNKYIGAVLRCDMQPTGYAGGGFFGQRAKYIRLVE